MKNIKFIFLLFLLNSCTQEKETMLHISGEFPIIENSYATIFFERNGKSMERKTALNEGRFNFYIDSLNAGVYEVLITWPWPSEKRVRTYRNKMGDVVSQKTNSKTDIVFHKKLYINPEQSLNYHIKPENIITDTMINSFDALDYKRTDLYRLQVISDAEDCGYLDGQKKRPSI